VLEVAFGEAGIPSVGVWARVPHYAAGTPYPEAAAALLDELASLTGVTINTELLHQAGRRARDQIQALIEASEEHSAMVRQLEEQHDAEVGMSATGFNHIPPATSWPPNWSGSYAAKGTRGASGAIRPRSVRPRSVRPRC